MKTFSTPAVIGTLLVGGFLTGCASAPSEQVTAAEEALRSAETAEANIYVTDLYTAAHDSFAAAQAEIEHQNGQFALSRDYDRAEQLLRYVTETASTAATQVEERKTAMRADTEALIAQAQEALVTAEDLLAQAPRGKEGAAALVSITADTGTAQTTLNDAILALQQGDIATAHQQAQAALDKANSLVQELTNAINKTQRS